MTAARADRPRAVAPTPAHQRDALAALAVPWADFWNRREREFLQSMTGWRRCSPAQRGWLDRLCDRARAARNAEGL